MGGGVGERGTSANEGRGAVALASGPPPIALKAAAAFDPLQVLKSLLMSGRVESGCVR